MRVSTREFGVVCDGRTDDSAAMQRAFDSGVKLSQPPGQCRITQPLIKKPASVGMYTPGLDLRGDNSILLNQVATGPLITLDTQAVGTVGYIAGSRLKGFSIEGGDSGIALRHGWQTVFSDLSFRNMAGTGLTIACLEGDTDGSVYTDIRRCNFWNNKKWGLNVDCAPGHNEVSFISVDKSVFQSCGNKDASAASQHPLSGAVRWKGQCLRMTNSGIVDNNEAGLFIYGAAGLGLNFYANTVAFENNRKRQVVISGLGSGIIEGCQFYNNADNVATSGILLDGTSYLVRSLRLDNNVVRVAPANSPHAMFEAAGPNIDNVTVRSTVWLQYDAPGQVRFSQTFTAIPQVAMTVPRMPWKSSSVELTGRDVSHAL